MSIKKRLLFFSLTIITGALFVWYFLQFSPSSIVMIPNTSLTFPSMYVFFLLQLVFMWSFFTLLLNIRRGLFISLFILSCFVLQLNHLANLFFIALLAAFFIILELMFKRQKKSDKKVKNDK